MKRFEWYPGTGIDYAALKRIRSHYDKPKYPMGEAWFLGDVRYMYHYLMGDIQGLSADYVQDALRVTVEGASYFGHLPEWHDWYHYLLGELLTRGNKDGLLESLINGFFAFHPNGIQTPPYAQFENDVLNTLGRCMMEPQCWNLEYVALGRMLHRSGDDPSPDCIWLDASGDFSASMFLCLKYLPPSLIPAWFASVLAIRSPHWRAQVISWLVGSSDMLLGSIRWPSEFEEITRPRVCWEGSYRLSAELAANKQPGEEPAQTFVPAASRDSLFTFANQYFTEDVYLGWLDSIAEVPYLRVVLDVCSSDFESLYVRRGKG